MFSIKTFERKNLRIIFDEKKCQIMRKDIQQMIAIEANLIAIDLYRFVLVDDIFFDIHFIVYHVVVFATIISTFVVVVAFVIFTDFCYDFT